MNYDNISAFESGVAIVQKDGYYGAILMGNGSLKFEITAKRLYAASQRVL